MAAAVTSRIDHLDDYEYDKGKLCAPKRGYVARGLERVSSFQRQYSHPLLIFAASRTGHFGPGYIVCSWNPCLRRVQSHQNAVPVFWTRRENVDWTKIFRWTQGARARDDIRGLDDCLFHIAAETTRKLEMTEHRAPQTSSRSRCHKDWIKWIKLSDGNSIQKW
jgi:hypothetical protein